MTDPVLAASEATPEEADALVSALPPEGQEAVVEAWLEAEEAERLRAIADGTRCGPATRKLARKALHILKTRGVHVPDAAQAPRPALTASPAEPSRGWISAVDGRGYQVFLLAYGVPGGGYAGAVGVRGGPEGLHEAVPFECAKKRLRELVAQASGELGGQLVPIDPHYLRWRLERSFRVAQAAGSALVDRVRGASRRWPAAPEGTPPHPVRALDLPKSGRVGAQSLDDADALFALPELRAWRPPDRVLVALDEALRGLDASLVVVSKDAHLERWMDTILDAVAAHYTEERRRDTAFDLEDTAFVVAADPARAIEAVAVLAAAADVRDMNIPAAEVAFLRLTFERLVQHPQTSEQAQKPPKKSKGGIILP